LIHPWAHHRVSPGHLCQSSLLVPSPRMRPLPPPMICCGSRTLKGLVQRSGRLKARGVVDTAGRAIVWPEKRLIAWRPRRLSWGETSPAPSDRGTSLLLSGGSPTDPDPTLCRAMTHEHASSAGIR